VPEELAGVPAILDELDRSVADLFTSAGTGDLDSVRGALEPVLALTRTANDLLPMENKKPKSAFRQLQAHVRFVGVYLGKGDLPFIRSNCASLRTDLIRLRAELASGLASAESPTLVNIEKLPGSPEKTSLRAALRNFEAGTYASAIVSAVNCLEGYLRGLRQRSLKIPAGEGRLIDVLDQLQTGGVLTRSEAPLMQVLRLYRNAAAHPSEFSPSADEARMVILFVFSKVKPR
jgi:hypothetical protein